VSSWDGQAAWTGDRVRREVFFFSGAGCELHGSLYAAAGTTEASQGLVVCSSWGTEADRSDRLAHVLALSMAEFGGAGLVFHYPGYGDSRGELSSLTMAALADAATAAAAEAASRQRAGRWLLAGFSLGASVACLAAQRAGADGLLLVQPALAPGAYFRELERLASRVTLGTGASELVAFGYPLPRAILDSAAEDDASVASALREFGGTKTVVRHEAPDAAAELPADVEVVTVPGTWRFGTKDHPELTQGAVRWLEQTTRAAAA
jgi:alpha/beta superfamily hydrolase